MNGRRHFALLLVLLLGCGFPVESSLLLDANNDRVDHGSDASLDNLDPLSFIAWVNLSSIAGANRIYSKGPSGVDHDFLLQDNSGNLRFNRARATTATDYITNDTPLSTTGKWYLVAVVFDTGAGSGEIVNIYVGDLTTAPAERTYGTSTDGSGALVTDASTNLVVGNKAVSAFNRFLNGKFAFAAMWGRALTLAEVTEQWGRAFCDPTDSCVLFTHYGFNGTGTQPDWSGTGNSGTVTGSSVDDHAPVALSAPQFGGTPSAAAARRLFIISKGRESKQLLAVQPSCPYGYEQLHRERVGGPARQW